MKKTMIIALTLLLLTLIMSCKVIKNKEKQKDTLIDLVLIPAGSFRMGNTGKYEDAWTKFEKPLRTVRISKSFYMSKYEITQAQYEAVMDTNPSHFRGEKLPVESVSWYDAVEFCNRLSDREGLQRCYSGSGENIVCNWNANGYRLPTEAEWEYAAKGGTETDFYSGNLSETGCDRDRNLERIAWYCYNSEDRTHPVGGKEPNDYGLYDMSGNVWEWCWDWYDGDYYDGGATTDPKGPSTIRTSRVLRGGSWFTFADYCRSSIRDFNNPAYDSDLHGFRIVRTN